MMGGLGQVGGDNFSGCRLGESGQEPGEWGWDGEVPWSFPGDREGAGLAPTLAPQPSCHVLPSAHGASSADPQTTLLQSSPRFAVYLLGPVQGPSPLGSAPGQPLNSPNLPRGPRLFRATLDCLLRSPQAGGARQHRRPGAAHGRSAGSGSEFVSGKSAPASDSY